MHRIRRHRSFLRTALLALVAFGVLLQPMLRALSELHEVEHVVALQSGHGHTHHDVHEEPSGDDDAPGDPVGVHNLLHQCGVAASMALLEPTTLLAAAGIVGNPPDRARVPGPPTSRLTLPFRPPIA